MGDKREIRVVISGDAKGAVSALNATEHGMTHVGGAAHTLSTAVGVTLAAGFLKAAEAAAHFVEESLGKFETVGAEVRKLERATGGSAKSMSELRYAAKVMGVDTDTLSRSFGQFEKHLAKNDDAAKSLGVSIHNADGSMRPFNSILMDTADHFASMPNGIEKTNEILSTFGKGGMALLPVLNQGSEGLRKMAAESDALGTTLSGKDVAATRQATIEHAKLNAAVEGLQINIGRYLLPVIEKVVTGFTRVVEAIRPAVDWVAKNHDAVVALSMVLAPLGAFIVAIASATKLWAIAEGFLNTVMLANPIVLVVAAVAALATGLIYAYQHSETFRHVVQAAFSAVIEAGRAVADFFSGPFLRVIGGFVSFYVTGVRWMLDAWMSVVGGIIHGAAAAFGWVPGVGGKLKEAAHAFDTFHSDVDTKLSAIAVDASRWGHKLGNNFGESFASGIALMVPTISANAAEMAQAARDAVAKTQQSRSPSRVARKLGNEFGEGYALGIDDMTPTVAAKVAKIVRAASQAMSRAGQSVWKSIAATVAPDVTDPARLAAGLALGSSKAIDTRRSAMSAGEAYRVAQVEANALDAVAKAARRKADALKAGTDAEKAAKQAADAHATALETQAQKALRAADQLKSAWDKAKQAADNSASGAKAAAQNLAAALQSQVDAFLQTVNNFTASMHDAILGSDSSLSAIWQQLSQNATPALDGVMTAVQSVIDRTQHFADDLTALANEGASQNLIEQIVGMGPSAGSALADSLLAAGQAAVHSLDSALDTINTVANTAADSLAKMYFGQGENALLQLIAGMKSEFPALQATLNQLTAMLTGIAGGPTSPGTAKAPTDAASDISTWASTWGGLKKFATGGIVTSPTFALIGEAGPEAVVPLNRRGAISAAPTINVGPIVINGNMLSNARELADAIRTELLKLGNRNLSVGLA